MGCFYVMSAYWRSIEFVSENKKTPERCLAAVKWNAGQLLYVPDALKTPEICLVAVKNNWIALQWVPDALRTPEMFAAAKVTPSQFPPSI